MSASGVPAAVEQGDKAVLAQGAMFPIDVRAWRDAQTLRPRHRVLFVLAQKPPVRQEDHIWHVAQGCGFRVTEVRRYPMHVEVEGEELP